MTGATGVRAVVELADQLHRISQGEEAAIPVVADVHHAATDRAITVQDVELPGGEIGILGPSVRHLADLRAVARPSDVAARQELTLGIQYLLALLRFVEKKRRS
jgi:hypothetical protein